MSAYRRRFCCSHKELRSLGPSREVLARDEPVVANRG
jgi:hypothetical protein